jgi:putative membrane protein (TIGR04086 family)
MVAQSSHLHWGRVLLTGVLIVILVVILNTVLPVIGWVWHTTHRQLFYQIVDWITTVLALLLTGSGALWMARKVERGAALHGFLVGLVVALILFLLSLGFKFPAQVVLVTFLLTVAAGWLGGVLGSRGREQS